MNKEIFREYDIRGIVNKDFNEDDVNDLGRAFAIYAREHNIVELSVGRDCRLHSERIKDVLIESLLENGMNVIDIGVCPTPVFYFSIYHYSIGGGMMITASHNPPEYNGFKMCIGTHTIFGNEIQQIRKYIDKKVKPVKRGVLQEKHVIKDYSEIILNDIKPLNGLKVGVDGGNATGGPVALPILEKLGCETYPLYCDMDGNFPNHEPDPTRPENMLDLINLIKKEKLDIGIGYDGDADRIGVVDETGKIIYGDKLLVIFARSILEKHPGSTFISEVKCSQTMYDDITAHGGNPIMWKTGHSLIKQKMKETNAILAGEMSGHMFFADRYFGYDDAVYASLRLLEILSQHHGPVSSLLSGLPEMQNTPEIRVDCPDSQKVAVVNEVIKHFKKLYETILVDGIRILFNDGAWGLVRASNTQPVLVMRFEAKTKERLQEIQKEVEEVVENIRNNLGV